MNIVEGRAVEPTDWFVVFHRTSTSRVLSFLAFGEFKHVSAFAYCAGFRAWMMYDVQWGGTALRLVDKAALMELIRDCEIVQLPRSEARMGLSGRVALYCVSSIKHLLRLRCVAVTPNALYRHILRNGGTVIGEHRPASRATA